jgi:hypothetical protein
MMVNTNRRNGYLIPAVLLLVLPISLCAAEPKPLTLRELAKESYEASYADFEAGIGKTREVYW